MHIIHIMSHTSQISNTQKRLCFIRSLYNPRPGMYFWDPPPVLHLYPAGILLYPWYIPLDIPVSSHFTPDPDSLYPTVHCIQLYPCVSVSSSYIQLYLLYPAVSHRIPLPRKWDDTATNTLQGRAPYNIHKHKLVDLFFHLMFNFNKKGTVII